MNSARSEYSACSDPSVRSAPSSPLSDAPPDPSPLINGFHFSVLFLGSGDHKLDLQPDMAPGKESNGLDNYTFGVSVAFNFILGND